MSLFRNRVLQIVLLAIIQPPVIHSVHLDVHAHCNYVTEDEWGKYDCLRSPDPLILDTPPSVGKLRIENVQSLLINLDLVTETHELELRNISFLNISGNGNDGLTKLTVLNSGHINANLRNVDSLNEIKILNTKIEDIQFPKNLILLSLQNTSFSSLSDLDGERLETLDLSGNEISDFTFLDNKPKLTFLNLARTNLSELPTTPLLALDKLNINGVHLIQLTNDDFKNTPKLKELYISQLPDLERIEPLTFVHLVHLDKLVLSENPSLEQLSGVEFPKSLNYLNLSRNSLALLPQSIMNLKLGDFSADGNDIVCDCRHYWLYRYRGASPLICGKGKYIGQKLVDALAIESCSMVRLDNSTTSVTSHIHSSATLTCSFGGNPLPSITWITPRNVVYRWTQDDYMRIPHHINSSEEDKENIHILRSGELYIRAVERSDIGRYTCTGSNPVSDLTTYVSLRLNPSAIYETKIISILVGLATCVGFLLIVVTVLLVRMIVERCGWRCCRKRESPQAKRVKTMLDNLEQYRSQQLDRLRDNYHQQVNRIKDNCSQQAERIRDTYQHRAQNVRDLKSYSTHHFSTIREQYNDQIKRVSDYSSDRLRRVRTNYVSQRERISRFSAQQLLRLRESAKFQQRTLNKIIENLPSLYLDNCRNGGPGMRSDSMYLDDDFSEIDMYIKSTISRMSLEFDDFHRDAIALETISEENGQTDQSQIVEIDDAIFKQPRASRQGSGTSLDLTKFIPTRFTAAGSEAKKNRRKKRPKTRKNVSVTVECCEVEVSEALLPQSEVVETAVQMPEVVETAVQMPQVVETAVQMPEVMETMVRMPEEDKREAVNHSEEVHDNVENDKVDSAV